MANKLIYSPDLPEVTTVYQHGVYDEKGRCLNGACVWAKTIDTPSSWRTDKGQVNVITTNAKNNSFWFAYFSKLEPSSVTIQCITIEEFERSIQRGYVDGIQPYPVYTHRDSYHTQDSGWYDTEMVDANLGFNMITSSMLIDYDALVNANIPIFVDETGYSWVNSESSVHDVIRDYLYNGVAPIFQPISHFKWYLQNEKEWISKLIWEVENFEDMLEEQQQMVMNSTVELGFISWGSSAEVFTITTEFSPQAIEENLTYNNLCSKLSLEDYQTIWEQIKNGGNPVIEVQVRHFIEVDPNGPDKRIFLNRTKGNLYYKAENCETTQEVVGTLEFIMVDDLADVPTPNDDTDGSQSADTDDDTLDDSGFNGVGALTTSYAMTFQELQNLGSELWIDTPVTDIKLINNNPIENIVSCKLLPVSISGERTNVKLGNVQMNQTGLKIANSQSYKIRVGSGVVGRVHNNFLDSAQFTKVSINLPYSGLHELDTNRVMGKAIYIDLIVDIVCGSAEYLVSDGKSYIGKFSCNMGIDIPVTGSNRATNETAIFSNLATSVAQFTEGAITENPLAMVGGVANGVSGAFPMFHTQTSGSASPSCGAYETKKIYLVIDSPSANTSKQYYHSQGAPLQTTKKLSSLNGFTRCSNVDVSGLHGATREEKERIKNLLESGVYL